MTGIFFAYVVVDEIRMHVVDAVVHDGGSDVLAGDSLRPGGGHVQVQFGLAAVLTRIFL